MSDVMYPVNRWVEVKARDAEAPRTIRLGVAQGDGRELFGVCMFDGPPVDRDRDVLSPSMSHFMWDGFAEDILVRAQRRGWHTFHEATPLKVSALELEVALYRLRLIHHLGASTVEEIRDLVESRRGSQGPRSGVSYMAQPQADQITVNIKDLEEVLNIVSDLPTDPGDAWARLSRRLQEQRNGDQ